ncbi:hypothetical protein ABCS02_19525 [Microbacterium sp. X-17]|uniref:hypothetical protein n=1 Tax=Microbacterium sp. X-17 TaxID=3144404 RepID=UPI0031F49DC9
MGRSAILTPERCASALELIAPTVASHLTPGGRFAARFGELVVLDPVRSYSAAYDEGPESAAFQDDVIMWHHRFGDPAEWDFDYGHAARTKAYLAFKHRLPSEWVLDQYGYLLEPDLCLYGGTAVDPRGGLIVGFSGAAAHHDRFVCEIMLAALRNVVGEELERIRATPDLDYVPRPGPA